MGCWVVPSIAAELWGVSQAFVLDAIRNGRLISKVEEGFTLVDLDPRGMKLLPPRLPKEQRPPTFTPIVTEAELDALLRDMPKTPIVAAPALVPALPDADRPQHDWQIVRRQAARKRRPAVAA